MPTKTDVRHIVREHAQAIKQRGGKASVLDRLLLWALPCTVGLAAGLWSVHVADALLAVISILAGLSFALAIFVFELRMTLGNKFRQTSYVLALVDDLFSNVLYSILVGVFTVVLGAVVKMFEPSSAIEHASALERVGTGLVVATAIHYLVTFLMCLKRLHAAYREIRKD